MRQSSGLKLSCRNPVSMLVAGQDATNASGSVASREERSQVSCWQHR